MIKHQSTMQREALTRQYERPEGREATGFEPRVARGLDRGVEVSLRVEAPGYGRAALSAIVAPETLAEIEGGDRPVDADLKIRVHGYGWRVVRARVLPRAEEGALSKTRSVRARVPGYGGSTVRMTF